MPRDHRWQHLQNCQLPAHLLKIVMNLYHDDEYILVDGDKHARVQPTHGVKQGCPLSPLLFSLYLNDIPNIFHGIEGACTGIPSFTISHLLYADDLCLTSNSPSSMQQMLDRLSTYSRSKYLTVNTQKSVIVCFNSRGSNLPVFLYDNEQIPLSDHFKYLGMFCDKNLNLNKAAEEALKPCLASMMRIRTFLQEHKLSNRLHACAWLFKVYVIPASMYASQIWATSYLRQGHEMENCIQKGLLRFLRALLGVRSSTPSWSVLRECGVEPIQLNWLRACARLYNNLVYANSPLLRQTLQADITLSQFNPACWVSHFLSGTNGLTHTLLYHEQIQNGSPLNLSQLVLDLRKRHLDFWQQPLLSQHQPRDSGINSRTCTYHHWCALPHRNAHVTSSPYTTPKYFHLDLPKHVVCSVARFRLRVHHLKIEKNSWDGNICPNCDLCEANDDVQDEQHVLFKCTHPHVCQLRRKYASLFSGSVLSISTLAAQGSPFLPASHFVHPLDMRCFLNQSNYKLCYFLHELLTFYEQASSQSI